MQSFNINIKQLIINVFGVALAFIILLPLLSSKFSKNQSKPIAQVIYSGEGASVKKTGVIQWEAITPSLGLNDGDSIYSGNDKLTYEYFGENNLKVTLAPGSNIKIRKLDTNNARLDFFGQGISLSGKYEGDITISDGTSLKSFKLGGNKIALRKDYKNNLIAVKNDRGEEVFKLPEEELKRLGLDNKDSNIFISDAFPSKGMIVTYSNSDTPELHFTWSYLNIETEGLFYELEISKSADFSKSKSFDIEGTKFNLTDELRQGLYYWRLKGNNIVSQSMSFYLRNQKRVLDLVPYIKGERDKNFYKNTYHQQMEGLISSTFYTDASKQRVYFDIKTQGVFDKSIIVTNIKTNVKYEIKVEKGVHSRTLPLGEYEYNLVDNFNGREILTPRKRLLSIKRFSNIELISPRYGYVLDEEKSATGSELTFEWSGPKEVKQYIVEISLFSNSEQHDKAFENNKKITRMSSSNSINIDFKGFGQNKFYWRVVPFTDDPGIRFSSEKMFYYKPRGSRFDIDKSERLLADRLNKRFYRVKLDNSKASIDFSDGQTGAEGTIYAYNYNLKTESRPHVENRALAYYADIEWSVRGSIPNSNVGSDNFVNIKAGVGYTVALNKRMDITPRIYVYRDTYYTRIEGTNVTKEALLGIRSEVELNYDRECAENYDCFSRGYIGVSNNVTGDFGSSLVYGAEVGITNDLYEIYLFYHKDGVDFGEINNSNYKIGFGLGMSFDDGK